MFLKRLSLLNFRNYSSLSLEFDQRPTIFLGNNAVGKSNLLEAIYFLSTTKSSRAETESEIIKVEEEVTRVQGVIIEKGKGKREKSENILEINLQNNEGQFRKQVKVNGIPRRTVDFIGTLVAVIFYPADLNMVTGSPSLRRWHLDLSLAQVDSHYKKTLTQYEQIVVARNRVLKRIREGEGQGDELIYWNQELVKLGKVISDKRNEFFEFVKGLKDPLGNFEFIYKPSNISGERLDQYSGREIASATTLVGPHRDDFSVNDKKRNLAHFGSRGEQRLATLAFKLAQLEYMAEVLGERPILLLDDVFSELDAKHRGQVIDIVGRQQTILATVELEHISKKFLNSARILKVEDGKISE